MINPIIFLNKYSNNELKGQVDKSKWIFSSTEKTKFKSSSLIIRQTQMCTYRYLLKNI